MEWYASHLQENAGIYDYFFTLDALKEIELRDNLQNTLHIACRNPCQCVISLPCHLPCFAELLLGVACVIAWWRFISSETFPSAWFSLNLRGERHTFPSQDLLYWIQRAEYTMQSGTVQYVLAQSSTVFMPKPQIHRRCTHTYTNGQYLSVMGKSFH